MDSSTASSSVSLTSAHAEMMLAMIGEAGGGGRHRRAAGVRRHRQKDLDAGGRGGDHRAGGRGGRHVGSATGEKTQGESKVEISSQSDFGGRSGVS